MKRIFVFLIIALFFVGCGNVKDLKFQDNNQDEIAEKVKKSKDLTGEEVGLFVMAMVRYSFTKESLNGKTVGEIINEQRITVETAKAQELEAKRLAEEALKKKQEYIKKMQGAILVTVYDKSFIPSNWEYGRYKDEQNLSLVSENKGSKAIRAYKGKIIFNDLFGKELASKNLSDDAPLKPGEKRQWVASAEYNQFIRDHQSLKNTDLKDMQIIWEPTDVLFDDGEKLSIEDIK